MGKQQRKGVSTTKQMCLHIHFWLGYKECIGNWMNSLNFVKGKEWILGASTLGRKVQRVLSLTFWQANDDASL